jgi:hypothetical protein
MKRIPSLVAVGLLGVCGAAAADDPCSHFAWNVAHELALFGGPASAAAGGKDGASAPLLAPEQLYDLALVPQAEVSFAHAPSKRALSDGAFAGLARLHIVTPGIYRVALDGPLWIDVIAGGTVLTSGAFTGSHECSTLSKLVEFSLPAGDVLVQLSGASRAHVHLALTPSPKSRT